jgi:hypothetical protein
MIIAYIGLGLGALLFVAFIVAIIVASGLDWYHYRRNRLLIELQRNHNRPRRTPAK